MKNKEWKPELASSVIDILLKKNLHKLKILHCYNIALKEDEQKSFSEISNSNDLQSSPSKVQRVVVSLSLK